MVVIARPIVFDEDSPVRMFRHLDRWATDALRDTESWGAAVDRCAQWVDYSPRNQVLLASYGVVGPVAGPGTWGRVPSAEGGRPCAPRRGEHGLPVRVPVMAEGLTWSQRTRLPAQTGSIAVAQRWELVYAMEQLARQPAPGALSEAAVPSLRSEQWVEVVRRATGRMLGRTPRKVDDASQQLSVLAAKAPLSAGRAPLGEPALLGQVAWSVGSRVGVDVGPMPRFDPSTLSPRERWLTLVDVRAATDRVLKAVSHGLGVDLVASTLPRVDSSDDREVAPTRRNYLSPADVRGLPTGVWVESGPYTRGEWLSRGVEAAGRAAHLRVNDRSYLAVYEARSGATWRLETTGQGSHRGLVAEGAADSFDEAKVAVRQALQARFPDVARAVDVSSSAPVAPQRGWAPLPGGRDARTERRTFDDRVSAMICPGPGGRWESWISVDGTTTQGPLTASAADARDLADALSRGELMRLSTATAERADAMVADLVAAGTLTRSDLDQIVGARLNDVDRAVLRSPDTPAAELAGVLNISEMLSPATIVAVLHHDGADATTMAGLVSAIGLPVPEAIRALHDRWGIGRLDAAAQLGASPDELQAAGATAVELLRAAPREVLRRLDSRERSWEVAADTLLDAGYTVSGTIRQLALHAPTPETFAAGVHHIEVDPVLVFATATREATVADLVALSGRYGLSPTQSAETLSTVCAPAGVVAAVVGERCGGDLSATVEACRTVMDAAAVEQALGQGAEDAAVSAYSAVGVVEADEYLALRAALGEPSGTDATTICTDEGLIAALETVEKTAERGLERSCSD